MKTLFYVSRIVRQMKWLSNLQSFAYVERGFARFDTKVIHQLCDRLFAIDTPNLQRIRIQLDAKPFEHAEFGSSILCPRRPIHLGGKLPLKMFQFCPLLTDVSGIQFSALTHLPNIENCSGYCTSANVSIRFLDHSVGTGKQNIGVAGTGRVLSLPSVTETTVRYQWISRTWRSHFSGNRLEISATANAGTSQLQFEKLVRYANNFIVRNSKVKLDTTWSSVSVMHGIGVLVVTWLILTNRNQVPLAGLTQIVINLSNRFAGNFYRHLPQHPRTECLQQQQHFHPNIRTRATAIFATIKNTQTVHQRRGILETGNIRLLQHGHSVKVFHFIRRFWANSNDSNAFTCGSSCISRKRPKTSSKLCTYRPTFVNWASIGKITCRCRICSEWLKDGASCMFWSFTTTQPSTIATRSSNNFVSWSLIWNIWNISVYSANSATPRRSNSYSKTRSKVYGLHSVFTSARTCLTFITSTNDHNPSTSFHSFSSNLPLS